MTMTKGEVITGEGRKRERGEGGTRAAYESTIECLLNVTRKKKKRSIAPYEFLPRFGMRAFCEGEIVSLTGK